MIFHLLGAALFFLAPAGSDGFKPLFNGNIEGWHVSDWSDLHVPQKVQGKPWELVGGELRGLGKRTWLFSDKEYGNFVLRCEWKLSEGANGGFGLRFPPEGDPAYKGMEIQAVDDEVYYKGKARDEQRTGSIYDEVPAAKHAAKPVGEWNRYELTCQGSKVKVVLNGETVVDEDLSKKTKGLYPNHTPLAERPTKGRIGFQNLNGRITLRNIEIKVLD